MDTQIPTGKTLGDFNLFTNKKFPLDCDGLNDLQLNDALLSVLGNVGGSHYIIKGCVKTAGTWSAGYIFTPTALYPQGELLYVESGSQDTIYVQTDTDTITASGYSYAGAYLHRCCKHGVGTEQFDLSTFVQVQTNKQLSDRVSVLENTVITPEAVGTIKMWPSTTLPSDSWMLCDGSGLNKNTYSVLFSLLGIQFGGEGDTFNLPDMRSRFPVAYKANDEDFGTIGKKGGEKAHLLTVAEMPSHTHGVEFDGTQGTYNSFKSSNGKSAFYGEIRTTETGGGQAHNNLPPYFVIPFIIKIK